MLKIISPDTVVALMPSPWCEKETLGTFLKSLSHIVKAVGTSSVSTGCNKGSSISFISGSHLSCHAEAGAFIVDAVNLPLQLTHRIASLNARHFI